MSALLVFAMSSSTINADASDRYSDTWVATDALGRSVSTHDQVGSPRPDKFVGIFYFLWLGQHNKEQGGPYDISKILAQDPDALKKPDSPLWGPESVFHYWGEPLFGYYQGEDPWVLRKHAQMLSDAGVDMVLFDVTNQATYPEVHMALCKVWSQIRKEGGRTPQIAFLCPFWNPHDVVHKLYDTLYSKNLYPELWFRWKGKPLILADPSFVEDDMKQFFTFRKPQADYFVGPTGPNQWGWLEKYPQHVFYDENNKPEQMVVGVGQNATENRLCAFSEGNTYGRSWHDGKKDEHPGAVNYGLNVSEQWERALKVDPEFIFITGWNEWIAARLPEFNGVKEPLMFVDQFSEECSRDIEPMKGGHADDYYYQMVDYIRKFKGARPIPLASAPKTIKMDGDFAGWNNVGPEYRDNAWDTVHRDFPGVGKIGQYVNNTGRNDFVAMKVARDSKFVYFYARTREPISPHTDRNWMMLFINSDCDPKTGWEGYNFVVNRSVKDSSTTIVEKSTGGWNWTPKAEVHYRVSGCEIEIAIPRSVLGFADTKKPMRFDFKWADNMQKDGDIMEFTVNGDTAPDGRFAYRFEEKH